MQIESRIKALREFLRMQQDEFAEQIGISVTLLNQMEKTKREVSEATILKICYTFKVRREWLDRGEGDTFVASENLQGVSLTVMDIKAIGKRLRAIRDYLGLNQTQIAKRIATTQPTYSSAELGYTYSSGGVGKGVCEVFKVNRIWLEYGVGPTFEGKDDIIEVEGLSSTEEMEAGEEQQKYTHQKPQTENKTMLDVIHRLSLLQKLFAGIESDAKAAKKELETLAKKLYDSMH